MVFYLFSSHELMRTNACLIFIHISFWAMFGIIPFFILRLAIAAWQCHVCICLFIFGKHSFKAILQTFVFIKICISWLIINTVPSQMLTFNCFSSTCKRCCSLFGLSFVLLEQPQVVLDDFADHFTWFNLVVLRLTLLEMQIACFVFLAFPIVVFCHRTLFEIVCIFVLEIKTAPSVMNDYLVGITSLVWEWA